ncbi:hypothetical protein RCJ22_19840 [Vibrio sp. FNV 38]|nr:hypothetical protein [Vibrio sp. FNV 38]
MKKFTLLATSVALALTGCNSSSSGDQNPPPASDFTVTAIDGYLQNAMVIGTDSAISTASCNIHIGYTGESGQFTVPAKYKSNEICIEAREYETIDSNRGVVTERFTLRAPSQSAVINPMTNMVSALADAPDVSAEQAREQVVEQITAALDVTPELIFGDYIADSSDEAEALNIIGEVLVDHAELSVAEQLEITKQVAEQAKDVIEDDSNDINDFNPVVDVDDNGDITVSPNQRPQVIEQIDPLQLQVDDALKFIYLNNYFTDPDGDALTYSMEEVFGSADEAIILDEELGIISGSVSTAGNFIYHVFATDDKGARSYPLVLSISVETEVIPPSVDDSEQNAIQADITDWNIKEGSALDYNIDVTGLFTSEEELRFEAASSLEWDLALQPTTFRASVHANKTVVFNGSVPRTADAGDETLTIKAFDGVNSEPTIVEFKLPKIELDLPVVEVNPDEFTALQDEVSDWVIYEGETLTNTLNAANLFDSNDVFAFSAQSSLEDGNSEFSAKADQNGSVSFNGNVPRSASAGQETVTVQALDESGEHTLATAQFKLPEIHEGATPPPGGDHPLEGTWYALEWGSDAGDGNEYDISRVWCDTIRLENGNYYFNKRQASNLQECSPSADVQIGTYTINGDIVELEFDFVEDDEHITGYAEVSVRNDLGNLYDGTLEVQMAFEDEGFDEFEIELFTWFSSSNEPERRLTIKSDDSYDNRYFKLMMPAGEGEENYEEGMVSMSLTEEEHGGNAPYDFDVSFDVPGHDFTCSDLKEFYYSFELSGADVNGNEFTVRNPTCFDKQDDGVNYAGLDFDVYQELAEGEVYSFVAFVDGNEAEYMQDIMFNITWTGEGDND